jgi:uncharacterized membrane protein
MKKRIWELDAFRGFCILGVIAVHFVYDLVELYGILDWQYPPIFSLVQDWGGVLFVALSGICVTLGRRSLKRGLVVFGCGMLISAVTFGMTFFGFHKSIIIYFGVLHCLGVCMLLWPLFRKLPTWTLAVLGIALMIPGLQLWGHALVDHLWLLPLGFLPPNFSTSDYFPLLPNLGYFLLGAVLGRTLYRNKTTLFPMVKETNPLVRFFCICGKASLPIYMLHQPILNGICMLLLKE